MTAGQTPEYQYFTSDLSTALVEPAELGAIAEPPFVAGVMQATIYLRDNVTGAYVPLVSEANTARAQSSVAKSISSRPRRISATC